MHTLVCIVRDFDPVADTCTVEIQGIGIVDAWIDGVAIAQTVDRSYIIGGAPGVVTMPDINRMCDVTLIQVTPPGDPAVYDPDPIVTYTGTIDIPTDASGNGCASVVFPTPYATVPRISVSAENGAHVTLSNVSEAGFTACVSGGRIHSTHKAAYTARSSHTSTPTKNKATSFYHNGDLIGTHFSVDYVDTAEIDFTVDNATGPDRATVKANLDPDYAASLGGGGSGGGDITQVTSSVNQVVTNGAGFWNTTDLTFDTVVIADGGTMYDGAHPERLKAPTDGTYHIRGYISDGVTQAAFTGGYPAGVLGQGSGLMIYATVYESTGTVNRSLSVDYSWFDPGMLRASNNGISIYYEDTVALLKDQYVVLSVGIRDWTGNAGVIGTPFSGGVPVTLSNYFEMQKTPSGGGSNLDTTTITRMAGSIFPPSGSFGTVSFDTVTSDTTAGKIWQVAHPTRLKAFKAGVYQIHAWGTFNTGSVPNYGWVQLRVSTNGNPTTGYLRDATKWYDHTTGHIAENLEIDLFAEVHLAKNDYIEAFTQQFNSGGSSASLSLGDAVNNWPAYGGMTMTRVG